MPRHPLDGWVAEQLRLTAFPAMGSTTRSLDWWEQVVGTAPDESTSNNKRGSSVVSGDDGPGRLQLRLETERIDWLLLPPSSSREVGATTPDVLNMGAFAGAADHFSRRAIEWLRREDLPEITRLAFGLIAKHPEADHRSGYLVLPEYVPVRVDPATSDFLYQINRPTRSAAVEGLAINRLSRWSIAAYRSVSFRVGIADSEPEVVHAAESQFALRAELDVNTAFEFKGNLPKERLSAIYAELVELGRILIRDGIAEDR